ncbi:MAG: Holliday junction branch migration protein RuvA [Verrucomicrobia bacterium]|nr:MAG: Holliday junction branch migration protein RuvA [Verrucomicrobiota bacterium]
MITFLEGTLVEKAPTRIVLDVHGVGYEVFIPLSSFDRLPDENAPCRVLIHDHLREDAHHLYGFITEAERSLFEMLRGISGIGPKTALSALSGLSVRDLKLAVVEGDVKRLSSISGIGKKTADRIVVELRHKLSEGDALEAVAGAPETGPTDLRTRDAILALISLGYKQADAQKRVREVLPGLKPSATVEDVVRAALAG